MDAQVNDGSETLDKTEVEGADTGVYARPSASGGHAPRWLRYALRLPLLCWHLLIHLPLVLLVINPLGERVSWGGEHLRHRAIRWWSGGLMHIFALARATS